MLNGSKAIAGDRCKAPSPPAGSPEVLPEGSELNLMNPLLTAKLDEQHQASE
ncbi:hypothetical protein PsW64_02350 [Pseudovibrio sp. W64]|nr:hypothetical protein PsW64_02350 [Pseudovibrio sp. W64]